MDCDSLSFGCNGGLPSNAFQYVAKNGIERSEDYPYKGVNQNCQYDSKKAFKNVTAGLGYINTVNNTEKMKKSIT